MTTTTSSTEAPSGLAAEVPVVALIARGEIIESDLVEFQGRGDALTFCAPDPHVHLGRIVLGSPAKLADLNALSFEEILDYLEELGERLDPAKNEHIQRARELTYAAAPRTKPLIDNEFRAMPSLFARERVREMADKTIGIDYLNGWVKTTLRDGTVASVRAFGARGLHIIPGNGAIGAAQTLVRGAYTRSDCIIKVPSNNPFAGSAIGRTMCEMAPDHPITKHVVVAYWRGGDTEFEERLCQPHNIEKIIAWGGLASVRHVTRYIQPGLELISLDPKYSASVVGSEALADDARLREAALRIAVDVGSGNQVLCSSARVVYVVTDGDPDAIARVNLLGEQVYEELLGLPETLSTKPRAYDPELRRNVESLRLQDEWYKVIGGEDGEGCVIVSQLPDPVDFTSLLADRTVNIVPLDTVEDVLQRFDAYTQTVGVFPEELKERMLDVAPLFGVQRFVSLGYSAQHPWCTPHDGLELDRRVVKWIVNLSHAPIPLIYAASANGSTADRSVGAPDETVATPGTLEAVRAHHLHPDGS